jgi:hypothetical protein
METNRPFMINNTIYDGAKEEFLTDFAHSRSEAGGGGKSAKLDPSVVVPGPFVPSNTLVKGMSDEEILLTLLSKRGYHLSSVKQLARLHGPDDYQTELTVISQVLAYFQVSSNRFTDVMPMIFETVFVRDFADELKNNLTSGLKLIGKDGYANCARFAKEEPEVQENRGRLERQRGILCDALKVVSNNLK